MKRAVHIDTASRYPPKIKKLREQFGAEGVLALYALWYFCIDCKPDGVFTRMLWQDLVRVSGYPSKDQGEKRRLIEALLELGLLDYDGRVFSIHNWNKHNRKGPAPAEPIPTAPPPRRLVNNRKVGYHPGSKEFGDGPQDFDL